MCQPKITIIDNSLIESTTIGGTLLAFGSQIPDISTSIAQFNAMDLRTGTVIEAEKIKKTKKLLNLKVDLGFEIRTIVSGIAESYTPEEMIGKKVTVLANLGSRTIKGVESQGMLLMTENKGGKLIVIGPEDATIDNGFEIN